MISPCVSHLNPGIQCWSRRKPHVSKTQIVSRKNDNVSAAAIFPRTYVGSLVFSREKVDALRIVQRYIPTSFDM